MKFQGWAVSLEEEEEEEEEEEFIYHITSIKPFDFGADPDDEFSQLRDNSINNDCNAWG